MNIKEIQKQRRIDKKVLLEEIEQNLGLVRKICRNLNISKKRFNELVQQYDLKQELDDSSELLVDFALEMLVEAASAKDMRAIELILKTYAKNRGFGDSHAIDLRTAKLPEWLQKFNENER